MYVKKVKDVESTVIGAGQGTSRQVLISPEQGPNFAMRKFVMQPGGDIPAHTNAVEHEQYVLGGRAQIGIGDEVYSVEKDDVVFIPAGVPHWYEVQGDEPFEFLCLVPNLEDKIELLK